MVAKTGAGHLRGLLDVLTRRIGARLDIDHGASHDDADREPWFVGHCVTP